MVKSRISTFVLVFALVAAAGLGVYVALDNDQSSPETNIPVVTAETPAEDNQISQAVKDDETSSSSSTALQALNQDLSVSITRTNLADQTMTVSAIVSGLDVGDCQISVGDSLDATQTSVQIFTSNGTSACTGSLDVSSLLSDDDWTVEVSAGDQTQTSAVSSKVLKTEDR